jgi:hypothetical protein
MTPKEAADLRRLISEMAGVSMPGLPLADVTPAQMSEILEAIGVSRSVNAVCSVLA